MISRVLPVFTSLLVIAFFIWNDIHNTRKYMEKDQSSLTNIKAPNLIDNSTFVDGIKLSKAELGKAGWLILHTMSVKYPLEPTQKDKDRMRTFLQYFAEQYPCSECSKHFVSYLAKFPPLLECRDDIARYLCQLHNEVNKFLKKPIFDCDKIYDVWGGDCGCSVTMKVPFACDEPKTP